MIQPVFVAGGLGTRLWPLSRELYPKQYLSFGQEMSMIQATLSRLEGLDRNQPMIVCIEEHRFLAAEQLRHYWDPRYFHPAEARGA